MRFAQGSTVRASTCETRAQGRACPPRRAFLYPGPRYDRGMTLSPPHTPATDKPSTSISKGGPRRRPTSGRLRARWRHDRLGGRDRSGVVLAKPSTGVMSCASWGLIQAGGGLSNTSRLPAISVATLPRSRRRWQGQRRSTARGDVPTVRFSPAALTVKEKRGSGLIDPSYEEQWGRLPR